MDKKINIQRGLRYMFVLLCVLSAISICAYWIYKFQLDEDLSVITYREFYEKPDDAHPTISLCLETPFLPQRLAEYGVNESVYADFLTGGYFSEEMLGINYENVTIDVLDYIEEYKIYFKNGSVIKSDFGLSIKHITKLVYVSYAGIYGYSSMDTAFFKCFALDIPRYRDLLVFRILISNNIFRNGERPTYGELRAVYHMPQQFMLSGVNQKWIWPKRAVNENYKMRFIIGGNTIMRKRNKSKSRCIESCDDYDDWVLQHHKNEAQCNIPYGKQNEQFPTCNTSETMKRGLVQGTIVERKNLVRPCKTIEGIQVEHLESTMGTSNGKQVGKFWFSVNFQQSTFTEIEQKRYTVLFLSYFTITF